jgi:hypothetical protein
MTLRGALKALEASTPTGTTGRSLPPSLEPVMPAYRIYFFGKDGHIDGAATLIDAPNDEAVIEKAKHLRSRRRPIEIWDVERFVARLDSSDD